MDSKKVSSALAPAFELTPQMWKFVEVYFSSLDVRAAESAAGLPRGRGWELLRRDDIQGALQQARAFRSSRTAIYSDDVLRRWHAMATASVNELVELRRINCRHCYGDDNRYQFTKDELRRATQRHLQNQLGKPEHKRRPFDDHGGDGYDWNKEPNPDCTECGGIGIAHPVFKDTRYLSPGAMMLFDGLEVTRSGGRNGVTFKLKIRDRGIADTMIARHLGLFNDRKQIEVWDPVRMSEEQLDAVMENLPAPVRTMIERAFGLPVIEDEPADS